MEVWKSIKEYYGLYEVNTIGQVRSLDRVVTHKNGTITKRKGKIIKPNIDANGYHHIRLSKKGKVKNKYVHKIMAENFLNHISDGYTEVVNHIDHDKSNNKLSNLELITQRQNANQKHLKSTSKYTGVYWRKSRSCWESRIRIKNKSIYLGNFKEEYKAHLAYQKALKELI